jgi:hypothetical protein
MKVLHYDKNKGIHKSHGLKNIRRVNEIGVILYACDH